ncbi:MAG: hypothetical protein BWX66_01757 [Deltaproteobacteria bacterium ADurb.Bin058]|nr:MAG: hypothetical protein BWX66_01757 [Deltaproteobacteria bacterium ADurb.Bin058]
MDEYQLVSQGEVFYVTELLAKLEGLERGPAGNTSLTAAITLARQMDQDEIVVVQETEYTGAGKHHNSQLSFAKQNGIEILVGDPSQNIPGKNIILPRSLDDVRGRPQDMNRLKLSYLKNADKVHSSNSWNAGDIEFLASDLKTSSSWVRDAIRNGFKGT